MAGIVRTYVLWLYNESDESKEEIAEGLDEGIATIMQHAIDRSLRLARVPESTTVVMELER